MTSARKPSISPSISHYVTRVLDQARVSVAIPRRSAGCCGARRDTFLIPHIQRVRQANFQVYGANKTWQQLQREGVQIARCTVDPLMRQRGLRGGRRSTVVRTTFINAAAPCPQDRSNASLRRISQISLGFRLYVHFLLTGLVYVALVIDVLRAAS